MTGFLLHFFPLFTIFLFCTAGVLLVRYLTAVRTIEKHMESRRPEDWRRLGKPSIYSKDYREKEVRLQEFFDTEAETDEDFRDDRLLELCEISRQLKRSLTWCTWMAFGLFIFTVYAVHQLVNRLASL